jgi:hypothetical protein
MRNTARYYTYYSKLDEDNQEWLQFHFHRWAKRLNENPHDHMATCSVINLEIVPQ